MRSSQPLSVLGTLAALFSLLPIIHAATIHKASRDALRKSPRPPKWPTSFEVQYTLSLPYVSSLQMVGLKIPVHVWYDGPNQRLRMDVYGGLDSTLMLPDYTYNTYPRITTKACIGINTTAGPTLRGVLGSEGGGQPLPDISSWTYGGSTRVAGGVAAHIWQMTEKHMDKTNTYIFYTAQDDGRPLKLYMMGVNLFTGSHFDEYLVDFTLFNALWPGGSAAIFKPPAICTAPPAPTTQLHGVAPTALTSQLLALLPASTIGVKAPAASLAAAAAARAAGSGVPGQTDQGSGPDAELELLSANRRFVEAWNQQQQQQGQQQGQQGQGAPGGSGFKLSLNKFATWSDERFSALSLGHIPSPPPSSSPRQRGPAYLGTYTPRTPRHKLPREVDWRGSGADGAVKDQASCGSCWAFATTGTMTGTWFVATGETLSLSEQQIVDCSWDYDVNGCWGGNGEPALEFIRDAGGAALGDDYPYIGQNGYCSSNKTLKAAHFSGYVDLPPGDEAALMEALASRGPLYVALDAVHPTFKFYSHGVYYRKDCGTSRDQLNHAVTLVGYGTTEEGVDYWLIRNSWSKLWGEDGYMKLSRKGNDCGITTAAVQAVVDPAAAARARDRVGRAAGSTAQA